LYSGRPVERVKKEEALSHASPYKNN